MSGSGGVCTTNGWLRHLVCIDPAADSIAHTAPSTVRKLGPGTEALGMRVGCHSGPVTAGVLRNQKSRFQNFCDTVVRKSLPAE